MNRSAVEALKLDAERNSLAPFHFQTKVIAMSEERSLH